MEESSEILGTEVATTRCENMSATKRKTTSGSSASKKKRSNSGTARLKKDSAASNNMPAGLGDFLPDLEMLYKDIHSHPELSMQEEGTAKIAAERLRAAGYEVTTGVGKTGVVGLLRNGDGPTVMLRADMDALPVKEATGL